MSNAATIREHEEGLLHLLPRGRRESARHVLDSEGRFPIAEFESYDPRWMERVPSERQHPVDLARELRARGAGETCVVFEQWGERTRVASLDKALALLDEGESPFVISCLPGRLAYYSDENPVVRRLLDRPGARWRWVAEFQALTARRAKLLRVFASFYEGHTWEEVEPRPEAEWREGWLKQLSGPIPPFEGDWPWAIWMEFDGSNVRRVSGRPDGEGLNLAYDVTPQAGTAFDGAFVRELTGVPPFEAIVETTLEAMSVLAEPLYEAKPESGLFAKLRAAFAGQPAKTPSPEQAAVVAPSWADRPPNIEPVGMRLQFGGGDLWIFNIVDELEIYGSAPTFGDPSFELQEYSERTAIPSG